MPPDPKPGARRTIIDPTAVKRATLRRRECVACGEPGANGHHVLERDDGGDDVEENIVTLCGSGTMGCHGAFHGSPYVATLVVLVDGETVETTERRTQAWVAERIGTHLVLHRPDVIAYVIRKLGEREAMYYLGSRYTVPGVAVLRVSRFGDTISA